MVLLLSVYPKTKNVFKKISAPPYALEHYLQQPRHGNNLRPSIDAWIRKICVCVCIHTPRRVGWGRGSRLNMEGYMHAYS